ncbi:M48 family metalloprotease [Kitasatospora acidiphila]|uniref:M48 family metalloprotease n=1 Tax=Kitasatospora acidiphila TaxID=2567942 RepID=UPI0015F0F55D|nr:M48 family metalloprotease [Kitasatospora acidiphila]
MSTLVGMYLLALMVVLVGLLAMFGPLTLHHGPASDVQVSTRNIRLMLPIVLAVFFGVFVSRPTGTVTDSVLVSPAEAPALWDQVIRLAAEVGTRPPTELRLVTIANAMVSEEAPMLGLLGGRRRLYLGVPLLMGLTTDELSAILCHELGHYAGRHIRLITVTYRCALALERTCERMRVTATRSGLAALPMITLYWVLSRYTTGYKWVTLAVRRRQENEADAKAALIVGADVTANALRRAHALEIAWEGFLATYVEPVRQQGFLPADLFEEFGQMLHDPRYQQMLTELSDSRIPSAASPRETHPPLAERLRRLDLLDRPHPASGTRDSAAAIALVGDAKPLLSTVQEQMYATARAEAVLLPSPRWTETTAEILAQTPARELLQVAGRLSRTSAPSLGTVLDLLEGGCGQRLGRRRTDSIEEVHDLFGSALLALVGQALVASGQARWKLFWTGPVQLVADESMLLELRQLVESAVRHPYEVDRLRLWLVLAGADLSMTPEAQPSGTPRPTDRREGAPAGRKAFGYSLPFKLWTREDRLTVLIGGAVLLVIMVTGLARVIANVDWGTPTVPAGWPNNAVQPVPPFQRPGGGISPPPAAARPLPSWPPLLVVTVHQGDTLSALAQRYGTTVEGLQFLNGLGNSTLIKAGDMLIIRL